MRKTPFLLPIDFQCTLVEPSRSIAGWEPPPDATCPPVVNASYAAGFPPSDTAACGPAVVVHAATQAQADAVADAYLDFVLQRETAFAAEFWAQDAGVEEALRRARTASRPIVVADTQDNPGAGGSGDTTGILRALHARDAQGVLAGYFFDQQAARQACEAGPGAILPLALGRRAGAPGASPQAASWQTTFEVVRCAQGPFRYTGPVAGNVEVDLGAMAVLRAGGIELVVVSRNVQAYDAAPFDRLGVDPSAARILVLKSSCHFRAVFEPMGESVMTLLSPGHYQPDPSACTYRHLRTGVRRLPERGPT